MKVLHQCIAGYLGYYASLEALMSDYPEGGEAGSFFACGETGSLWMWNPFSNSWCDTGSTTGTTAQSLCVVDPDGNGQLTVTPQMCALTIKAPDGSTLARLAIEQTDTYRYVSHTFTQATRDMTYTTTITAHGIEIVETNTGGVVGVVTGRCIIDASGINTL